jgi:hypothetical protein
VVWSFVYVALCRLLQRPCCSADRSARKSSRSSCSGMNWRSCAVSRGERGSGKSIGQSWLRSHGLCREVRGRACPCVRRPCCAGMASWSGALDVPPQAAGTAAARSSGTSACCSARTREPALGFPTDRRRTAKPRHLRLGDLGEDDPRTRRSAPGAGARRAPCALSATRLVAPRCDASPRTPAASRAMMSNQPS